MAEGFEQYHVPQQSRRDKLRVVMVAQTSSNHHHHHPSSIENLHGCTPMVSFQNPPLLPSDFLTSATTPSFSHHPMNTTQRVDEEDGVNNGRKHEEGVSNLVGSSYNSTGMNMYIDPESSVQLNPSPIQEISVSSINPFRHYTTHPLALRFLDQSYHGDGGGVPPPSLSSSAEGLSLSLSSSQTNLPLELNLPRYDDSAAIVVDHHHHSDEFSRISSSMALGSFMGSRFFKPAQQLLEELVDGVSKGICSSSSSSSAEERIFSPDPSLMEQPPLESFGDGGALHDDDDDDDPHISCRDDTHSKKSRLISMLYEVYRRYKQYYQQMQSIVVSFESVTGLSNAAPFANLALKSMSKHFRSLKNALINQLHFASKSSHESHINYEGSEVPRFGNLGRGHCGQRTDGIVDHHHHHPQPVWRPQRGLPERAVNVLRAWLFDHFLHPYPTDTDKLMLAKQTGLTRNQVSNWFINARVRLWKPMVEEIHMLETQESQKALQRNEHNSENDSLVMSKQPLVSENPPSSDFPSKRTRNDIAENHLPIGAHHQHHQQPVNLSYEGFSHAGGSSNGVQLTLGLHQNNGIGIGLSETFPINAAQRFSLDSSTEGILGFEVQNRQFGRNIVGPHGHLVRDFVG